MREIKFRAWDLEGGADGMMEWELVKYYTFEYLFENKFLIPMQYTGVKDRKGIEIYEGDIVRSNEKVTTIIWLESEGGFYARTLTGECFKYAHNSIIEIIGNIYENPELIK